MRYPHLVRVLVNVPDGFDSLNVPVMRWRVVGEPVRVLVQRTAGREVKTPEGDVVVADQLVFGPVSPPWTSANRLRFGDTVLRLVDVDPDPVGRAHHSETVAVAVAVAGG